MIFCKGPILAIETSCDETSAAVVVERVVRSNVVASQIDMHQKWGGVVPEAAARAHVQALLPTISQALKDAHLQIHAIEGVAVTNRPGLVGALSVGVSAAKALALANQIPLLGIHHLEGHIAAVCAVWEQPRFPFVTLIASGGHTELVLVGSIGDYTILGQTIDDAAGEAFDKGARAMGLPYPGGRAIQEQSRTGNSNRYRLPRGLSGETLDFSFSGLKTAVLRLAEKEGENLRVSDAAASLQDAITSVLVDRSIKAALLHRVSVLALVGGVAANELLRQRMAAACAREGLFCVIPPLDLCTDNAAMIGLAASIRFARGEKSGWELPVLPNESLEDLRSRQT